MTRFYVDDVRYIDESRTTIAFSAKYDDAQWIDYTTEAEPPGFKHHAVWARELIESKRAAAVGFTDTQEKPDA